MEKKFNGNIPQKIAERIEECNCDTCKWFSTVFFGDIETQACRLVGAKTKFELVENTRIFQVCEKYEVKEK